MMLSAEISEYSKDRKILKTIDHDTVQHVMPNILGYLGVFVLLMFPGDIYSEFPKLSLIFGIAFVLTAMLRAWSVIRFEQQYGRGPQRWRRQFIAMHYLNASIWSMFFTLLVWEYGLSVNAAILLIFSLGFCAVSMVPWAPYIGVNQVTLSIILLPVTVALTHFNMLHAYVVATMMLLFYWVLLKQASFVTKRYWQNVENEQMLKAKVKEFEISKRQAEQAGDIKMDFLTNITHEIRTPMNSVLGMLSLLGDSILTKEQREFQQVATNSGESLLSLIDDILDFSQLASGKVILETEVFNLRKCIEEVMELHGPVAHEKGVELSAVFDQDIPLRVRGDAPRLAQIVSNLINNAIKFSDNGEVVVEVHLTSMGKSEGLLRIHVVDNGIGISKEKQGELFEGFKTLDATTTRKNNGTGLGLSICKGLVECMNGNIGLVSEEGKGSTFWFTAKMRISTQQAQMTGAHKALNGLKALLVGTSPGCERGLIYEFEKWGIQAEGIDDYDKALQVLRTSARQHCGFDFVVLDLGLTYQNTLKLSLIIAEDPLLKDVKQIILTTLVQRGSNGCVFHKTKVSQLAYVTKPIGRMNLWRELSGLYDIQESLVQKRIPNKEVESSDVDENNHRILLVEDNKVNQMVAKGMLKRLGYAVKVVNNGKEALGIIADKPFDLILMDCIMPEMDGYDTTKEIRSREKATGMHIPIIAMTANAMEGEEAKCLAAGMDDYLSKPVDVEKLDSKIKMWLMSNSGQSGVIKTNPQYNQSTLH